MGRRTSSKKVMSLREQASKFLRMSEAFLIVFFIGFLMELDQISATYDDPNTFENLSKSNN